MPTKQVIVIRRDLNMRTGKMIAQGAHASIAFLTKTATMFQTVMFIKRMKPLVREWMYTGSKKIVVYVNSEDELLNLHMDAQTAGLTSHLVTDSGLTEFKGVPTNTCIAIGPDDEEKIDKITGSLKLL